MRYSVGTEALQLRQTSSLATLEAVTEACVALLRIDVAESHSHDRARRRRRDTESELDRLEALRAVVEQDIAEFLDGGADSLRQVAGRVASALESGLRETRAALLRDAEHAAPNGRSAADAAAIERVVGALLARCDLPGARWELRWSAGAGAGPALADAVCSLPAGIEATFSDMIERGEPWHAPRVDRCVGALSVLLPDLGQLSLSRYVVYALELSRDRKVMVLSRSPRGGDAVEVVVRAPGQSTPTVRRAEEPTPLSVTPDVAATLESLWAQVVAGVFERVRRVDAVQKVTLEGADVRGVPRAKALAAALLDSIGSLARDVRRGSRLGSEIEGLRERYADLPVELRSMFSAHGFDPTGEIDLRGEVDEDAPTRRIRLRLPLPPG